MTPPGKRRRRAMSRYTYKPAKPEGNNGTMDLNGHCIRACMKEHKGLPEGLDKERAHARRLPWHHAGGPRWLV